MADYRARSFMAGRFIRHQQILGTRPEGRSAHAEQLGVPKPDARGHDARSAKPGARWKAAEYYHDPGDAVWRPRPGRDRVGRNERNPTWLRPMVETNSRRHSGAATRAMNRLVDRAAGPITGPCSSRDETSHSGAWGSVRRGGTEINARWDWVFALQFLPGESTLEQEVVLTRVTEETAAAMFIERGQVRPVDDPIHTRWISESRPFPVVTWMGERRSIVTAVTS
jgi:hypothetical protein